MKPSQLHRWLSETAKSRQNMHETSAREIEKRLQLEEKWLDQEHPHETGALSQDEAAFIEQIKQEIEARQVPSHMRETILAILSSSPQKK